jgi:hypothetical protein
MSGKLEGWCIVSQMGHRTIIGEVKQLQMGETVLLRVDVPEYSEEVERWTDDGRAFVERNTYAARFEIISPASIYSIAPVTEEVARKMLGSRATTPQWVEPKLVEPIPQTTRLLPGGLPF